MCLHVKAKSIAERNWWTERQQLESLPTLLLMLLPQHPILLLLLLTGESLLLCCAGCGPPVLVQPLQQSCVQFVLRMIW
jgi:hypothetical protein